MLRPVLVAGATALSIISLAEAKAWCRVEHDYENDKITALINAAEALLDGYSGILGRALFTQTWSQQFCAFADRLDLPVFPAASIVDVKYYDASNALQTLGAGVYQLQTDARGPYVSLVAGQSWPSAYSRIDAVKVTWLAGSAATDIPAPIKLAMRMIVEQWYDDPSGSQDIPPAALALLAPFRRVSL